MADFEAENQRLREELAERDEQVDEFEARLRQSENLHPPRSKHRNAGLTCGGGTGDDDDAGPLAGPPVATSATSQPSGRHQCQTTASRSLSMPVRAVVTLGDAKRVTVRLVEEMPEPKPVELTQYNRHHYCCDGCGEEPVATDPHCPTQGQIGVNVIAEATLDRHEDRLPYRKIAERFHLLHGLSMSDASPWQATERAARRGRSEYERLRRQIEEAAVVHGNETGIKRDGD